jgi:hypothetical protein
MIDNLSSESIHEEWLLALDLVIARAALDDELRAQLLNNTRQALLANGVDVPVGVNVILTHPDQPTIVREIPGSVPQASFERVSVVAGVLEHAAFNGTTEYTEVETTEAEAEETSTTTTAEAEAEVVVVAT